MALFHTIQPLVLASGSPRRQELLKSAGILYTIKVAASEETPQVGEAPADYALRAARDKAHSVFAELGNGAARAAILAADTIVVLDGRIIGKPKDHADALHNLQALAGATHTVITACCLLRSDGPGEKNRYEDLFHMESRVRMWQAPLELLKAYADSEEPMDKAGGYAVQGSAGFLVDSIEGSWSNVVGLPLTEVVQKLLEYKIIIPARGSSK